MAKQHRTGKLAVILHADIAGSTQLVHQDEQLAHERIQDSFRRFGSIVTRYHGRVRELRGDALLAEFERASGAVSAALAFQEEQADYIHGLDDGITPTVRVGIAMGEVVIADNTITGAGVVLAQRLEQLAEPGDVVIQALVHETIPKRYPFTYTDLGIHQVKGFDQPVQAYGVGLQGQASIPPPDKADHRLRNGVIALVSIAVIAGGAALLWMRPWEVREDPASVERMALPLPDKPSIAVQPFDNLSGDPNQGYFVDGFTENIITELSRFGDLFVIASDSTFSLADSTVKTMDVSEKFGVQYVLKGSVQKAGETVRVTTQLFDALTGRQLWAERYDRKLTDIFSIHDEITQSIVSSLPGELARSDLESIKQGKRTEFRAYDYYLLASEYSGRYTREDNEEWRRLLGKAIEIDPGYARAYVELAWSHFNDWWLDFSDDRAKSAELAVENAKKAVELDNNLAEAHWVMASVHMNIRKEHDTALSEYNKALSLNPNNADIIAMRGWDLPQVGRAEEGVVEIEKAMRLNPRYPDWYAYALAYALYNAQRYEEVVDFSKTIRNPRTSTYTILAGSYAKLGDFERAQEIVNKTLTLDPDFSLREWTESHNFVDADDLERYMEGLRLAGFPQNPPLKLPDKPTIAVLPFLNMSEDREQEYFSDGMTEDLITDLSKVTGLTVISRSATFAYRDKSKDIQSIARELNASHVIEGSVRKSGGRVRINTQLTDALTGTHLWADRYDRNLEDIFTIQDDVLAEIVSALAVELTDAEEQRLSWKGTDSTNAYDMFIKGRHQEQSFSREGNAEAIRFYQRAIEIDPSYAMPYARMANMYDNNARIGWSNDPQSDTAKAIEYAKKSIELDDMNPFAYWTQGRIFSRVRSGGIKNQFKAVEALERAIELDPSYADAYGYLSYLYVGIGRIDEALSAIETAIDLNPQYPFWYIQNRAVVRYMQEDYEAAIVDLERSSERSPTVLFVRWWLAAAYAQAGQQDDADWQLEEMMELGFNSTVKELLETSVIHHPPFVELFAAGLQKAGIPEG